MPRPALDEAAVTTLLLVDADARAIVTQVPCFDPATQGVGDFRALVDSLYAVPDPLAGEERHVPGPPSASAVRVLVYRPKVAGDAAVPAILYLMAAA